jgi:hypothetical protein
MPKAILIPCSPLQSCQHVELPDAPDHLGYLAELVGGEPEEARYDPDASLYVDDNGIAVQRARNERATRYALAQSEAARQHGVDPGTPMRELPYALHGDAVLVGRGADGELTDVPDRFLDPGYLNWDFEPTPFDSPLPPRVSPPGPAAGPASRAGRSLARFTTRATRPRGTR